MPDEKSASREILKETLIADPLIHIDLEPDYEAVQDYPRRYQVILLNDDFTPMEFVVHVLQTFFYKSPVLAEGIMLKVHHEGQAVCGTYPRDVAETLVMHVIQYARTHNHPLKCIMQRGDTNAFQKS